MIWSPKNDLNQRETTLKTRYTCDLLFSFLWKNVSDPSIELKLAKELFGNNENEGDCKERNREDKHSGCSVNELMKKKVGTFINWVENVYEHPLKI